MDAHGFHLSDEPELAGHSFDFLSRAFLKKEPLGYLLQVFYRPDALAVFDTELKFYIPLDTK